ncbi:hypothetical protein VKT23_013464 [Stygiomarasmius scandens]|uniref:alpha-L-fucosidase n=1 Tax=Marasmiellus scandens TaxID=2682957 RepID=A0ABR1J3H8_9AGAR
MKSPPYFSNLAHAFLALHLLTTLSSSIAQTLTPFPFSTVNISQIFDNTAASPDGSADFDGHGNSFDSQFLPTKSFVFDGITYDLPTTWGAQPDNVMADGQVVTLDEPTNVHEVHLLLAGDADFGADFNMSFVDGSTQSVTVQVKNWWIWANVYKAPIQTPNHFEQNGATRNLNLTNIYQWSAAVLSESPLQSITLPTRGDHTAHIFGMAITPSASVSNSTNSTGPALSVRRARFSSRWEMINGVRAQAVEVTLANLLPLSAHSAENSLNSNHSISISGDGIQTVLPGTINRLVPGDQARVDVFVTGSTDNGNATVELRDSSGSVVGTSEGWATTALIENWTPDKDLLNMHETPSWWNNAKFGIFIHWGPYSYPAWSPPSQYAEWYDWDLHNVPNDSNPTWVHHRDTYGESVVYDDFIPFFNATKFNASAWVDLFDRAGAKYFVLVTKHHDGFALFDTGNTSDRNSLKFGPKRDLLSELFETSAREKPNLHRGTYFSMPEWFHPDFAPYGFSSWPGGLAHNAFNASETESYTGYVHVDDYIKDLQLPQMLSLAEKYGTEILWCDIGGPNMTIDFAPAFYNAAMAEGRQVTLNDRCGFAPDFTTPEYTTFNSIQTTSWESNEGMDPFSYGLNANTNASQYKNGTTIIQTLVDIVSKNGNFLLDVGPTAEGEIIAPMADNLLDAGGWLAHSGECVYDTKFWFQTSQDIKTPGDTTSPSARFTTTPTTFCIVTFSPPEGGELVIDKRVPLLPGDEIVFLSPNSNATSLPWTMDDSGRLTVDVSGSTDEIESVKFAWAFQVRYKLDQS